MERVVLVLLDEEDNQIPSISTPAVMIPRVGDIIDAPFGLYEVVKVHWSVTHVETGTTMDAILRVDVKGLDA